jgi:hypothetical protein
MIARGKTSMNKVKGTDSEKETAISRLQKKRRV